MMCRMHGRTGAGLLLALAGVIACATARAATPLQPAIDAMDAGRYEMAERIYRELSTKEEVADVHRRLARLGIAAAHARLGLYEQAIREYLEIEAGDYRWSWAGSHVAYEAARAGGLQELVIPVFEHICSKEDYKDPHTYLIQLYRDVGNIAKANDVSRKKGWDGVPVTGDLLVSVNEFDRFTRDDATRLRLLINNLKDAEVSLENRKYQLKDAAGKLAFEGDVPPTRIAPKGLVELSLPVKLNGSTGALTLTTDVLPAFSEVICVAGSRDRRKAAALKAAEFSKLTLMPEDAAVLFGGEFREHTYVPTGGKFRTNRAYCALSKDSYAEFAINSDARVRATVFIEWANPYGHSMHMRLLVNDDYVIDDRRKMRHDGKDEGLSDLWLNKGPNSIKVMLGYPNTDGKVMLRNLVSFTIEPRVDDFVTGSVAVKNDDVFFYGGTEKTFLFTLENYLDKDVAYDADIELRLQAEGRKPFFQKRQKVQIAANGSTTVEMPAKVDAYGAADATINLSTPRGIGTFRTRMVSLHMVPDEFNDNSPFIMTWNVGEEKEALHAERAWKIGIRWSSDEIWWAGIETKQGEYNWERYDKRAALARKFKTYVIPIPSGCPDWANLWHGDTPEKLRGTRARWKIDPKNMQWYEDYLVKFIDRYGDIIKAFRLWNESYEGGGVSGWGYRGDDHQAYILSMKKAIQRSNHKDILIVGPDAHCLFNNAIAWNKEACDAVGVGSYHPYTGATMPLQIESGPYFASLGKQCWNTESWDRIYWPVKTVCMESAIGVQKTSPYTTWHLDSPSWLDGFAKSNALLHFSFYSKFCKEINPHCMPWMFAFKATEPRGTNFAIVFGRIFDYKLRGYPLDQIAGDATLTIGDPKLLYSVYGLYGNPVDAGTTRKTIPLNMDKYYILTKGDIDELVRSLEMAEIAGCNPVQIGVYDLTKPFDRSPALKVELQNALNVPISGTIRVTTPPDLKLKTATLPFKDLIPGKRTLFEFPVAGGAMNAENRYPLKIAVDTPKGRSELAESISLALIKRGTPEIRADATSARITAGWEKLGAVPVSILAEGNYLPVKDALALLNWKPADGDAPSLLNGKGIAKVAAMYDDQYFYLLAQVLDGREEKGQRNHSRVSMMGEWFKMMDPPADMVYARGPALPSGMLQIAFDCIPADKQPQYYPPDSPYHRRVSFFDTDYEFSIYQTTGGKPEVWCNLAPGIRYDDFYPFTPKGDPRQDVVADARASITHDGEMRVWVYQVAIPLARLKDLNPKDGGVARFNFLVRCVGHWSENRSTCVLNRCTFHPTSGASFSDDVEWGFAD